MKENLLIDKSIAFAARIVKLHQHLVKIKNKPPKPNIELICFICPNL
ncbi:MAG: hypothetical protein IKD04_00070 [Clostridia bacterium]|nr:hypothetical protein [Clostridia bacterium]